MPQPNVAQVGKGVLRVGVGKNHAVALRQRLGKAVCQKQVGNVVHVGKMVDAVFVGKNLPHFLQGGGPRGGKRQQTAGLAHARKFRRRLRVFGLQAADAPEQIEGGVGKGQRRRGGGDARAGAPQQPRRARRRTAAARRVPTYSRSLQEAERVGGRIRSYGRGRGPSGP